MVYQTFQHFLDAFNEWQEKTFPSQTVEGKVNHLKREIAELESVGYSDDEEWADCFLLLFGAAFKAGLTFDVIFEAMASKHEKNERRTWGPPNDDGSVSHVE